MAESSGFELSAQTVLDPQMGRQAREHLAALAGKVPRLSQLPSDLRAVLSGSSRNFRLFQAAGRSALTLKARCAIRKDAPVVCYAGVVSEAAAFAREHPDPESNDHLWAFDVLRDAGYRYSSSVYPIAHDHYGMPDSPRFAYPVREGLLEIPVTTLRVGSRNLPSSGGGYFRLLPYALSRWMIRRVNEVDGESAVFYFHPWEIDPGQPRVAGIDAKTRFRHYVNIARTEGRIGRLLEDFRWGRMDEIFLGREASPGAVERSLSPA